MLQISFFSFALSIESDRLWVLAFFIQTVDSDQTGHMPRLICVFKAQIVGFVTQQLYQIYVVNTH